MSWRTAMSMAASTKNSRRRPAWSVISRATRSLPPAAPRTSRVARRMPRKITRLPTTSENIRAASTTAKYGPTRRGDLSAHGVALGFHLLTLALELLREEVVEHRPDHHYGSEEQHVVEVRSDRGAQDVGPDLELQPERQVTTQEQPDLGVGVLSYAQQGEQEHGRRRN